MNNNCFKHVENDHRSKFSKESNLKEAYKNQDQSGSGFFQASQSLNWKIYCHDRSSLSLFFTNVG